MDTASQHCLPYGGTVAIDGELDAACCQGVRRYRLTLKRRGHHMEGIVAVGIWRVVEMWTLHCQGLRRYRLTLKRRGPSLTIIMEVLWLLVHGELWKCGCCMHGGIAKV